MRKLIHLAALATPSIRTASYDGESHLVVPVVALVSGVVVRPLGSDGPEYVPPDVISRTPAAWDDRPVFLNHPENGSIPGTDPATLESQSYGRMFNTCFSNNALQTEVYLSDRRAAAVGQDAVQVLKDLRAGTMREISVGAYVDYEKVDGVSPETGEPYSYRWRQVVPLHLAVGLPGAKGACSLNDGCGALRTALKAAASKINSKEVSVKHKLKLSGTGPSHSDVTDALRSAVIEAESGGERIAYVWVDDVFQDTVVYSVRYDDDPEEVLYEQPYTLSDDLSVSLGERKEVKRQVSYKPASKVKSWLRKLGSVLKPSQGITVESLWNDLAEALYSSVPAFAFIEDVEIDSKNVIYSVEPPNSPPVTYRRGYKIRKGNVTLTDDEPQQVTKSQPEWVPVAAQGDNSNDNDSDSDNDVSTDCGCNPAAIKPATNDPAATTTAITEGDDIMSNHRLSDDARAKIIAALIAHDATPFQDNEDDKEFLNAWTCDRLENYQRGLEKATETSEPATPETPSTPTPMSNDEWWKNAPVEVRSMATHYQAQERQEREGLIATLSSVQSTYDKKALESMDTTDLRRLLALHRELKGEDQNASSTTFPAVNYGLLPATPPVTTAQYDSSPPDPFAKSNTN